MQSVIQEIAVQFDFDLSKPKEYLRLLSKPEGYYCPHPGWNTVLVIEVLASDLISVTQYDSYNGNRRPHSDIIVDNAVFDTREGWIPISYKIDKRVLKETGQFAERKQGGGPLEVTNIKMLNFLTGITDSWAETLQEEGWAGSGRVSRCYLCDRFSNAECPEAECPEID